MGMIRMNTDGIPIENLEGAVLTSAARTASPASTDLMNGGSRDLYLIVDVTAVGTNAGVAEVASLAVTAGATASGNVTVTLNGVAQNVAVTAGTAEVDTVTFTAGATTAGNVTVTLNGVGVATALAAGDTIAAVAGKVAASAYAGWTAVSDGVSKVTFTKTTVGTNSAPTYADTGATGATATTATPTAGVAADTSTGVATKIRAAAFAGWTTGGTTTTVTFTATAVGVKTDAIYSAGTTGATGTMTTPTQGVDVAAAPSVIPKVSGKDFASGKLYSIGTVATALTAVGTYVYMYSKNAGTAHDGITAVFDSPIPKHMVVDMTHGNATSITYSVGYALCL